MNLSACLMGIVLGVTAVVFFGAEGIDLATSLLTTDISPSPGWSSWRLTAYSLWLPPALALLFGFVSALWPITILARRSAADILRMA